VLITDHVCSILIKAHECLLMLVERKAMRRTGDVVTEKTRSLAKQLRPV